MKLTLNTRHYEKEIWVGFHTNPNYKRIDGEIVNKNGESVCIKSVVQFVKGYIFTQGEEEFKKLKGLSNDDEIFGMILDVQEKFDAIENEIKLNPFLLFTILEFEEFVGTFAIASNNLIKQKVFKDIKESAFYSAMYIAYICSMLAFLSESKESKEDEED